MQFSKNQFFQIMKPIYLLSIFIGVLIDLITKYIIIQYYSAHVSQPVINDFFRITLTFNTGFVFGIAQNNMIFSIFTTGFAILFLLFYRLKNSEIGNAWGWNLVMIGAFGNFIDKFFVKSPPGGGIRFGLSPEKVGEYIGVVDFLDFDWPDFLYFHRWPAFNFADSCVSVGLVILLLTMNKEVKNIKESENKE